VKPTQTQTLLLHACLLSGEAAIEAYRQWRATTNFEALEEGSFRLLPLLYANLKRLGVQDDLTGRLSGIYRQSWLRNQFALRALSKATATLEGVGIPTLVLKGAALGATVYRDSGARQMNDADLLVPTARRERALEVLLGAGWRFKGSEVFDDHADLAWLKPRRATQGFVGYAVPLRNSEDLELDLHAHATLLAQAPEADAGFWQDSVPLFLFGSQTRALCLEDAFLNALVHGVAHSASQMPITQWIADAVLIARTHNLEWSRIMNRATELEVVLLAREALAIVQEVVKVVPSEIMTRFAAVPVTPYEHSEWRWLQSKLWFLGYWRLRYHRSQRRGGWATFLRETWKLDHTWQIVPYGLLRLRHRLLRLR
jgi:hypothetical protein